MKHIPFTKKMLLWSLPANRPNGALKKNEVGEASSAAMANHFLVTGKRI